MDLPIGRVNPDVNRLGGGYQLGVGLKALVGEDIGVGKGGNYDVQRLAVVWRLVVRELHPKERQRLSLILSTSLERGRTSRNLPPLSRGSNQPWYSGEDLLPMTA